MNRLTKAVCASLLFCASLSAGNAMAASCSPTPCVPGDTIDIGYGIAPETFSSGYGPSTTATTHTWFLDLQGEAQRIEFDFNGDLPENLVTSIELFFFGDTLGAFSNPAPGAYSWSGMFGDLLSPGVYELVVNLNPINGSYSGSVAAVPIPAAAILFGSALLGFAGFATRRRVS